MKNLIINKTITLNKDNSYSVLWFIVNPECKEIAFNNSTFNNLQEIEENELSIKQSILDVVNDYLEEEIYQLDPSIIPLDFYDKTQEDGKNAVNSLMRELLINSQVNNLPREINKQIEIVFKPVVDALS